jgi:ADP-dependent NAD(P)H-hydrate dehydratase / NAD(P)H-hydrate epimerase
MTARFAHDTPVYRTADVRAIERGAETALPLPPQLMQKAGLAGAEIAREVCGGNTKSVLIFAGPGNNGGDAFVLARHLKQWWFNVTVVFAGEESKLAPHALEAFRGWRTTGGAIVSSPPAGGAWGLAVDGIFGIGLEREITGRYAEWIAVLNGLTVPVLALDLPSGLHADTGRVMGCAVRAAHTATFIALKPGLLTLNGPDLCGSVHLCTLDLNSLALRSAQGRALGAEVLATVLKPRARNSHKGDYGSVGIVGGDQGMAGAALLAGRAAIRSGTGRVYVGMLARNGPLVDQEQPELMLRSADEVLKLDHLTCLAVGPGLGHTPDAAFYLDWALDSPLPLVLDADALNLLATSPPATEKLAARKAPSLLTPHPAEAGRLLGVSTRELQDDRVAAAIKIAQKFNALVVLKGAGSVCTAPDATWHINTSGNPGMASAGMGDVLTGMVAALLAQGLEPRAALLAAVYAHGAAADALVTGGIGPVGLTAGEVIDAARSLLNFR